MAKVTGKLQITLPKAAAEACGIRVGDSLEVRPVGRTLQLGRVLDSASDRRRRLEQFDRATARQRARTALPRARSRGWSRAELYGRGRAR